jgi:hypothetical protein
MLDLLSPDTSSHDNIITTLTNGLDRLAKDFPWLTGQVFIEGAEDGNTGVFKITSLDKIQLVVKDLQHVPCTYNRWPSPGQVPVHHARRKHHYTLHDH